MGRRADIDEAVARVAREESATVIGAALRIVRDVGLAEEAFQEALEALVEHARREGLPERPGAWVMTVARRKAIDQQRRKRRQEQRGDAAQDASLRQVEDVGEAPDEIHLAGDRLRLVVACCHPKLPREAAVALTLRLVCGLTTEEIARAFVAPTAVITQRLSRAKKTLRRIRPVPEEDARLDPAQLGPVLESIYLIFNEGWTATRGDALVRENLCADAMRLAAMVAQSVPDEAEAWSLLALLELHASRAATRADSAGAIVLLADQDRRRWDRALVTAGLRHVDRARSLGPPGPFGLQALIASCHACALTFDATDFRTVVTLYDLLLGFGRSPVIELNRAAALAFVDGPDAGLQAIAGIRNLRAIERYAPLHATRAELHRRAGDIAKARRSWVRARDLTRSEPERAFYERRIAECDG